MATLTLTIVPRGEMTSYRVTDAAGRLIFAIRAYRTDAGRDGARERLRARCKRTEYKVVLREEVMQTERRRQALKTEGQRVNP